MSCSYINRNFRHLIFSLCTVLLFVSSCTQLKMDKLSISTDILKQYVGSYQIGPSIARVTLEGNQLFVSSCPIIGLSLSPDIVQRFKDSDQQESEFRQRFLSEINLMSHAADHKQYPLYAISETRFTTKVKYPAIIDFCKNDEGEVTHIIVIKKLADRVHLIKPDKASNLNLGFKETGIKIKL